jgi:hypothetical protein
VGAGRTSPARLVSVCPTRCLLARDRDCRPLHKFGRFFLGVMAIKALQKGARGRESASKPVPLCTLRDRAGCRGTSPPWSAGREHRLICCPARMHRPSITFVDRRREASRRPSDSSTRLLLVPSCPRRHDHRHRCRQGGAPGGLQRAARQRRRRGARDVGGGAVAALGQRGGGGAGRLPAARHRLDEAGFAQAMAAYSFPFRVRSDLK